LRIDSQNSPPPFEVIVVDQNIPNTRRDISRDAGHVRQVFQEDIGLSAARNLGIAMAEGDIVAFIDDDAVACPDWTSAIVSAFQDPLNDRTQVAGGKVEADYRLGRKPEWMTPAFELYLSCLDWSREQRLLRPGEWIVGANMAFRRHVFSKGGGFDVSLGRKGKKTLLSNEEAALISRLGLKDVLYLPHAKVRHIIQPERLHQGWFRKRVYWQAVSDLIADSVYMTPAAAWECLGEFLTRSPAELRSIRALFLDCSDAQIMDIQLRAIYGLVVLGADGFLPPSGDTA
jgi:glycosyltransferase involved in cell wall biosynthesis